MNLLEKTIPKRIEDTKKEIVFFESNIQQAEERIAAPFPKEQELFDKKIDARVVGASLETIKKIPNKLVVAVGKEKEKILTAALRGGLVDSLYIDEPTAELIVRHNPIN